MPPNADPGILTIQGLSITAIYVRNGNVKVTFIYFRKNGSVVYRSIFF